MSVHITYSYAIILQYELTKLLLTIFYYSTEYVIEASVFNKHRSMT